MKGCIKFEQRKQMKLKKITKYLCSANTSLYIFLKNLGNWKHHFYLRNIFKMH